MSDRFPDAQPPPIRVEEDGFDLFCLAPGPHRFDVASSHAVLDIYLGTSEAQCTYLSLQITTQNLKANTFSFVPPGFAEHIDTIRAGASVIMTFRPDALRVIPVRDLISDLTAPIWNIVDPPMSGAGIIARDYLMTPNHIVRKPETHFLRDLLSIRFLQVLSKSKKKSSLPNGSRVIKHALEYVDQHISDKISLEDLARHCGVSPFHLARLFRNALGVTIRRYVILRRLELAQVQIASSDRSLAEIAYSVGFSSQSHMTTLFTRFTGRTPSSFRGETIL